MLKTNMYVRCPADVESEENPRAFVCGQIAKIDNLSLQVTVKIHDPFKALPYFEDLPKKAVEKSIDDIERCKLFNGSTVVYKKKEYKVLAGSKAEDEFYYYYLQNVLNSSVIKVCETDLVASFNNGKVDAVSQLMRYELQNPCWYLGRSVVSKNMNLLEQSIFGFKELAGAKIYLLPHQVNTIMRCLQESPCRYMLADEVGMGKTIEAISIYKLYRINHSDTKALIIVPNTLKEQWRSELLVKFSISIGSDNRNNQLTLLGLDEVSKTELEQNWDFVIIDEVHKFIFDSDYYEYLHKISKITENILLLSATPVQQREEDYLQLLRLLLPDKYDHITLDEFKVLISRQNRITQNTALLLDTLSDYEEEIENALEEGIDPHQAEDCREIYEEIFEGLSDICDELADGELSTLLEKIEYDNQDLGVYSIKVIISYICSNYQIESNIIRNRRKLLECREDDEQLMATRELIDVSYTFDADNNTYEYMTYEALADWINEKLSDSSTDIDRVIKPLLSAFFSSPWAFNNAIADIDVSDAIKDNANYWLEAEKYNLDHICLILEEPDEFNECYSTRMVKIIDTIYEELYDEKIVLFTNFKETFDVYKKILIKVFDDTTISFFGKGMQSEELELNSYKFQTDPGCKIMLCDSTGGEGRNFQCADYIVHIDLPWDASAIEQRIGRLDRLERDMSRPIVYSLVVHSTDTFEDGLFKFFRDGLKIFNKSLSGMEIIMKDVNEEITAAIKEDFKYGLMDKITTIVERADFMREAIRKEQNFDAAGFIYRPMYNELSRLIDYYTRNDNDLFAKTMLNWASLAGFRGHTKKTGEIVYSASSFSPKSAINAQFIPPRWSEYMEAVKRQMLFDVNHFDDSFCMDEDQRISGTFSRKQAIENDYLHFFAPGDEVFDCIVDNAMNSCKGCSTAFAVECNINWKGLIFTWSIEPNISTLLDEGVSIYALSPYRNYLHSEQIVIPVSIDNKDDISDKEIIREYNEIINDGILRPRVVHLGKRDRVPIFLRNVIFEQNINWFKRQYRPERWEEILKEARKIASDKAKAIFTKRSNIKGAKHEMDRNLSARAANMKYYGMEYEDLEELKRNQEIILKSMKAPVIKLEAAAYVMMVHKND